MRRLRGGLQNYAWGSRTLIADLTGREPSEDPEAEIWYGAHPGTATMCDDGSTLLDCIQEMPIEMLGQSIVDRFGSKLPFLLKLLAAGSPLSIQAHPSIEQAQAGFAAEEAAGVDRSDPARSFKDDNHKPELICALTAFEALVGFRPVEDTVRFFEEIGFTSLLAPLQERGPKGVVEFLLDPQRWEAGVLDVTEQVSQLEECARQYQGAPWAGECALILRLAEKYEADPGIAVAALLNYTVLEPGEALYLGAGNMHAYVSGLGVEIMANSDNVLRGGLTPKHIDVPNLLDVVLADTMTPERVVIDSDGRYLTPAPEFELRRLDLSAAHDVAGPCIILCTEGTVVAAQGTDEMSLLPTEACWLGVNERAHVHGSGQQAWLATVGSAT